MAGLGAEIRRELETSTSPIHTWLPERLVRALDLDGAFTYRPALTAEGYTALSVGHRGLGADFARHVDGAFRAERTLRIGHFDPLRPSSADRNTVRSFSRRSLERIDHLPVVRHIYPKVGLDKLHQARVLLCDGSMLLAGVWIARESPLPEEVVATFRGLVRAMARRVRLEHAGATLGADVPRALDGLDRAAVLFDGRARISYASPLGAERLADAWWRTRALSCARTGHTAGMERVSLSGGACVVFERPRTARHDRLVGLTPRQSEVLDLVVEGKTNKEIALQLRLAEVTVELHVTAILRRAGVRSRVDLVRSVMGR